MLLINFNAQSTDYACMTQLAHENMVITISNASLCSAAQEDNHTFLFFPDILQYFDMV